MLTVIVLIVVRLHQSAVGKHAMQSAAAAAIVEVLVHIVIANQAHARKRHVPPLARLMGIAAPARARNAKTVSAPKHVERRVLLLNNVGWTQRVLCARMALV
jgi:hypothetical protein